MAKVDDYEIKIFKEPVLYFISLRCKILNDNGNRAFVHTVPIVACISDLFDDVDTDITEKTVHLDGTDVVLGIIPAPVGTFKVSAWIDDWDEPLELGFEYPGIVREWTTIAYKAAKFQKRLKLERNGLKNKNLKEREALV